MDKARYTAIVFAIPGGGDVDRWLKDWYACPELGHGISTSGLLINGVGSTFLAQLDTYAHPPRHRSRSATDDRRPSEAPDIGTAEDPRSHAGSALRSRQYGIRS